MNNLLETVRNAVRAIIIKDNKLLVLKKTDGPFSLPGGAPNTGETLADGLLRECQEEIGCRVKMGQLIFVGDYFKPKKSSPPSIRHQIEFFFLCAVEENYIAKCGHHPDKRQTDVLWLELATLEQQLLSPIGIIGPIKQLQLNREKRATSTVYLGTL